MYHGVFNAGVFNAAPPTVLSAVLASVARGLTCLGRLRQGDAMRRFGGSAALIVAVLAPPACPATALGEEVRLQLARSSVSSGESLAYVRGLTAAGPRLTGSAAYQRAAEWSAGQFRAMANKAADTIDRVDVHNLAVGGAVVAATAYAVADAAGPMPPRLDRRSVEPLRRQGQ